MREVREILLMTDLLQEARERVVRYFGSGVTDIGIDHANRFLDAFEQAIRADAIQQERSRYEGLLHDTGIMLWFAARWIDDHDDGGARDMQESMRALGIWMFNGGIGPRPSPPASFDALKETIALAALTPSAPAEKEG